MVVADRREGADLALAVEGGERGRGRMPLQARVLAEARARARGQGEVRPQLLVARVADRGKDAEGVDAAVEESLEPSATL